MNLLCLSTMYQTRTKQLLQTWGGWLSQTTWDYFSTYTFRYDISPSRNEKYMLKLESYLQEQATNHRIFWVVEPTGNGYQSHSHFLIKGEEAKAQVLQFYTSKGLVNPRNVLNDPYEAHRGAEYYISKTIHHENARYGFSYSPDNQYIKYA